MQELVLLGLLNEGPKHGYEIKKEVDNVLKQLAGIAVKSIYYALRKLEAEGMITKTVARTGRRPEKYVYRLTDKGNEQFHRLLNRNFLVIERPCLNIDASLYFLQYLDPKVVRRRLQNRLNGLRKIKNWVQERERTLQKERALYHMVAIVEHSLELVKSEIRFTQRLIKQFS